MHKKEKELQDLIKLAKAYIKNAQFDKAVQLYHTLNETYENIPKALSKTYEKEVLTLFKELILYITTNEAYYLAEHHGELKRLGQQLREIHELQHELQTIPDAEALLKYVKPKFTFCLDIETYRNAGKKFDDLYKHVDQLITEGHTQSALKQYAQLLLAYNNYIQYEKRDKSRKIYNKLMKLYTRLKNHKQVESLYERPTLKQEKPIKVKQRHPMKITPKDDKLKITPVEDKESLDNIAKLLKKL